MPILFALPASYLGCCDGVTPRPRLVALAWRPMVLAAWRLARRVRVRCGCSVHQVTNSSSGLPSTLLRGDLQ